MKLCAKIGRSRTPRMAAGGGAGKVKICPRNRVKDPENGLMSIRGSWSRAIWGPAVLDPFKGLWRAPKSNLGHFRGNFFTFPNIVSIKIMKKKRRRQKDLAHILESCPGFVKQKRLQLDCHKT